MTDPARVMTVAEARAAGLLPKKPVDFVPPTEADARRAREAQDEAELQAAIVSWLKYGLRDDVRFTAVPLGGKRRRVEAARLIGQGVAPGWPDLSLVWGEQLWTPGKAPPRTVSRSAFMEVKTRDGRLSAKQRDFQRWCLESGVPHAVVRSLDEAVAAARSWGIVKTSLRAEAAALEVK